MTFEQLNLPAPLLRAVAEAGYTTPSPIQAKAIPPVAAGRDLMGCAQTGTGKTAAFALPMLQRLAAHPPRQKGAIRALILTPTRELALQIGDSFAAYGKYLKLKHTVIFGGVGQAPQVAALQNGVEILIACPGRLNDLIGQGYVKLDRLEIFVLDEADRMLDMGFVHDVKKVIARLPKVRQNLMFSATMPKEIEELAGSILRDPAFVKVDPPSSTVERIAQTLYYVPDKAAKRALLPHLIETLRVENALVFSRTKHGADRIAKDLCKQGIPAAAIHGNKSQSARVAALEGFKAGKTRVLVATDIAARGIDISELAYVFNFDLPEVPETYVHRIGRTARAGADGCAVSFCTPEEREYLAGIEKLNRRRIPVVADHPWHDDTAPAAAQPVQAVAVKKAKQPTKQQNAVPAPAVPQAATEQNILRNEEVSMENKDKRPAEGQTGLSASAKRRRRRRGSGKGSAEAAAVKTEQAAAPQKQAEKPAQTKGSQPRRERGGQNGQPKQAKQQPQQPKFDPRFLTAGAAQAVRGGAAPAAEKSAQPAKAQPAKSQPAKGAKQAAKQQNQPAKQPGKQQPAKPAKQESAQPAKAAQNGQPKQQPVKNQPKQSAKQAPARQPAKQEPQQPAKSQNAQPKQSRQSEQVKAQPKQSAPRQSGKAQPRRTREEDPGLILISRRPPQQKFASFEEYMTAHGGVTAPVEDYSNE